MGSAGGGYTRQALAMGYNDKQADLFGAIMGSMEGATEAIGGALTANVGKKFASKGLQAGLGALGLDVTENFLEEAIMEPIQELTKQSIGKNGDWKDITKRMLRSGLDGALTSIIMGGVSAGVGSAVKVATKAQNNEVISQEEIKQALQDINKSEEVDIEKLLVDSFNFQAQDLMQVTEAQQRKDDRLEKVAQDISQDEGLKIRYANLDDDRISQIENSELSENQINKLLDISNKYDLSQKDIQDLIDNTKNGKYEQNQATTTPNNEILNQEQQTIQQEGKQAQNQTSEQQEENKQEVIKNQENIKENKEKQLKIIQESNPMQDDYHTGIRNLEDIKTFAEAIEDDESFVWGDYSKEDAQRDLEKGTVTVYSSKPIEDGVFVSTSKNQAQDYAGNEKIYSQEIPINDVAWINGDEGQYAKVDTEQQAEQPVEQTVKEEKPKKQIEIYNQYKKKIIERNEKAVNNLISYKNQTTTELDESIAKKEALLASKKNKNTKVANTLRTQIENLKARKAEIEIFYNEKIDKFNNKIDKKVEQEVQKQMKQNARKILEDEVVPLLEDSDNWVDKKAGIKYSTETAERNIEDIVKDKEKAQQINEAIFQPIHKHIADAQRGAKENFDKIKDLKLDKKKKYTYIEDENGKHIKKATDNSTTYKVDEATLAQLLVEKKINENDLKEYGVDVEKIKNTAEVFKDILANYYDRMNETVVKYGYAPIGKIENYFPHFTENKPDTLLGKVAGLFGIDTTNQELPTEISGRTEQFKPGRVWNSNILKRLGNKTDYDALKVMERYILGAEDIINTTDDIQKLRQFSKALRYKYSEKAIQDTIESFENNNDLTVQEKEEAIENLLQSRSNKLHQLNHFATWLDDYTNILANKKNSGDREFEKQYNRSMYKNMSAIESRIASNTIGGNVSVSLTNFAPLFQAFGTTKASNLGTAIVENMRNGIFDIMGIPYTDYVQNSDFLASRFGVDGISKKTALQKVENVLATPMELADRISAETIVRAKYRENLQKGMNEEQALKEADNYARRLMADRSKGALPVAFNNKNPMSKLLTMYQVEPNNLLRNYFKDMPRNAQNSKQLAWQYMKLMGSSWAFNTLAMAIRGGNEVLPDPIRMVTYLMKYFTSDDDDEKEQAGKDIQEAIFGVIPFAQNIGGFLGLEDIGRVPISNAMPDLTKLGDLFDKDVSEDYKKELLLKEFSKPVLYLGMPVRRCASR